jgi:hypothetical protein
MFLRNLYLRMLGFERARVYMPLSALSRKCAVRTDAVCFAVMAAFALNIKK